MSSEQSGYGRKWKRWLAIYLAVGAVAYVVLFSRSSITAAVEAASTTDPHDRASDMGWGT